MKPVKHFLRENENNLAAAILQSTAKNFPAMTASCCQDAVKEISGRLIKLLEEGKSGPSGLEREVVFFARQAREHFLRGVGLEKFMSFMKYCRQVYAEFILASGLHDVQRKVDLLFDQAEVAVCRVWTEKDTWQERAGKNCRDWNRLSYDVLSSLPANIAVLDRNGTIVAVNKVWLTFAAKNGIEDPSRIGPGINYLEVCRQAAREGDGLARQARRGIKSVLQGKEKIFSLEYPCHAPGDPEKKMWFTMRVTPLSGKAGGAVVVHVDITERKLAEKQLQFVSLHDTLTGLYNRMYFEREMRRWQKKQRHPIGVVVCDVDGLKIVNDSLGHDRGDKILVAAAGIIRRAFGERALVARIGGDEFAALVPGGDQESVAEACRRIKEGVDVYNAANPSLPLDISVGSAVGRKAPVDLNELYKEADYNMYREKLHRIKSTRSAIVQALMKAMKARDCLTEEHEMRLQELALALAEKIGLPEQRFSDLRLLAQFHDIGKVGIPDKILFEPGPLTGEEMAEMQRHCEIGYRIACAAPDLAPIADWILKHHEWWNGEGYPLGLKGEEIPLECRILAIVDAYDAMTSDRPYRKAMTHEQAVDELKRMAGIQFDPHLVDMFLEVLESLPGKEGLTGTGQA